MTPILCCGFECGVAVHWTPAAFFDTGTVRNGARSMRFNLSAASSNAQTATLTSAARWICRIYVRFATLPTVSTGIFGTDSNEGTGGGPKVHFNASDNKIYAKVGTTLGATGVSVTTGQWYRLDCDFNIVTGGSDTCDVQVDGTACGQATATGASSQATSLFIGGFTITTCDIFFDDFITSNTAADYPIGDGKVLSFVPDADGTHTATGTDIVKGTTGAPTGGGAITSSTTDAFNWVNGRPLLGGATDNTRLINQQTVASTEYAEVDFETTTEANAPRAVEVITADRQAGTQTCMFATKLNDNGTEDTIITRNAAGVTSDRFVTKQYATMVGGGAWTLTRFNALKARFGYSTDATPDVYWRGIMIEAEFPPASASTIDQWGQPTNQPRFERTLVVAY